MKPCKSDGSGALLCCAMLASSPTNTVCLGRCASRALHCIRAASFFKASSAFLGVLLSLLFVMPAQAADLAPKLDIGKGGQCVEDPKIMRTEHMKRIMHQRDETVRKGIRGSKYDLTNCVECHASEKNHSVIGSNENFCQGCHAYAAVKIDCFQCHSSKPREFMKPSEFAAEEIK